MARPRRRMWNQRKPIMRERRRRRSARLARALEGMRVGKLSGAVGTYASTDPELERLACERLGLLQRAGFELP